MFEYTYGGDAFGAVPYLGGEPLDGVTGVAVRTLGDRCEPGLSLPRAIITWTPPTFPGGTTENAQVVWRRDRPTPLPGEDPPVWVPVARLAADATTYTDHTIRAYTPTEYAVTWEYVDGGDRFSSSHEAAVAEGYVEYDWAFLHDIDDPSRWMPFYSLAGREQVESERSFDRLAGDTAPTAFIAGADYPAVSLNGLPEAYRTHAWRMLRELHRREHTAAATICLRPGAQRGRYIGVITGLSRVLAEQTYDATLDIVEAHFDPYARLGM